MIELGNNSIEKHIKNEKMQWVLFKVQNNRAFQNSFKKWSVGLIGPHPTPTNKTTFDPLSLVKTHFLVYACFLLFGFLFLFIIILAHKARFSQIIYSSRVIVYLVNYNQCLNFLINCITFYDGSLRFILPWVFYVLFVTILQINFHVLEIKEDIMWEKKKNFELQMRLIEKSYHNRRVYSR